MYNLNKTYFYVYDTRQDWNWTTFFSFWNDFYRTDENAKYAEFVTILLLSVFSILVNAFFIIMYTIKKGLRSNQNKYVLAILLVNISYVPICIMVGSTRLSERGWMFGDIACRIAQCMTVIPAFVKICLMAVISIDRYIKVVKGRRVSKKNTIIVLISVIVLPAASVVLITIPNSFSQDIQINSDNFTICTTVFKYNPYVREVLAYFLSTFSVFFIVPAIIITACYILIMKVIKRSHKSLGRHASVMKKTDSGATKYKKKTTSVLIAIVVLFLTMWLPLFLGLAFVTLDTVLETYKMSARYYIAITCVMALNTIIEPFLYLFTSSYVRKEIYSTLCARRNNPKAVEEQLNTISSIS